MSDISAHEAVAAAVSPEEGTHEVEPPLWLLAELTYRCPLHCAFCYNPVNYAAGRQELDTDQWIAVFREARALGPFAASGNAVGNGGA